MGGVVAEQIRRLATARGCIRCWTATCCEPPLLAAVGAGEVSRIGEVILNPYLGPRLKSGSVTTDMPMAADKPIDFGLQRFCEAANKCARECRRARSPPGPSFMYNGLQI